MPAVSLETPVAKLAVTPFTKLAVPVPTSGGGEATGALVSLKPQRTRVAPGGTVTVRVATALVTDPSEAV